MKIRTLCAVNVDRNPLIEIQARVCSKAQSLLQWKEITADTRGQAVLPTTQW